MLMLRGVGGKTFYSFKKKKGKHILKGTTYGFDEQSLKQ